MIESGSDTLLVRIWLLGEFHAERRKDGAWEAIGKNVWGNSYARSLMKRLLCATNRRVALSDILDDLWPNTPAHLAEKYLNNASSKLRQIFHKDIIKPLGSHGTGGYQLTGQSLLWTDVDACESLMIEAERIRPSSPDYLSLLEEAHQYFKRGSILEGESGQWCLAVRTQQETALRYCNTLLAKGYEGQGMFWQAKAQYQNLLAVNPLDEDALCRLLALLHHQGMQRDLRATYEEAKSRFREHGLALSQTTKKTIEKLLNEPFPVPYLSPLTAKPLSSDTSAPLSQLAFASFMMYNSTKLSSSLSDSEILMRSRRQVLQDILNTACAAVTLSPYALLPQESRESIDLAVAHPSYINEEVLADLASITQRYWGLSRNALLDLLSGVAGHFTTITQLLKDSHPTPIYERLCSLASENALLLGEIFHDIQEIDLAWEYYKFALKIAQDSHSTDLWASAVGRIALLLIHWGQPQQALPLLQEANKKEIHNQRLRSWLFAIEAEIQAMLGNVDACRRSLDLVKHVNLPFSLVDDTYKTGFNLPQVAGYEGACFIRLHQPERALPALKDALISCDPTASRPRLRAILLTDIGTTYAQLGDVKMASASLLQALDMTTQTKSFELIQRIYKGKSELDPWKNSTEVKNLDERIHDTFTTLIKMKEHV